MQKFCRALEVNQLHGRIYINFYCVIYCTLYVLLFSAKTYRATVELNLQNNVPNFDGSSKTQSRINAKLSVPNPVNF